MWETWVWTLDWEDPLEKGKDTHSSILAWRIPWTVYSPIPWVHKELYTTEPLSLSHVFIYVCSVASVVSDSLDSMDCSLLGSSVNRIFQARTLEWVAKPSSRGSSWPRDLIYISCIAGSFFTAEPLGKPTYIYMYIHTFIYIYIIHTWLNGWIIEEGSLIFTEWSNLRHPISVSSSTRFPGELGVSTPHILGLGKLSSLQGWLCQSFL